MRAIGQNGVAVELYEDGTWSVLPEPASVDSASFRGVAWGTRPESAKLREIVPPAEESPTALTWSNIRLGELTSSAIYVYVQDALVRGKYWIDENWVNENRFLQEYRALKALLAKKYGGPDSDESYWSNDLWKDDPDDWGKAVEAGHLSFYSTWERGDTRILLYLNGENYATSLGIEYASLSLEGLEDAAREAAILDEL